MTNLTKKSVRFHWNDDCQITFETLKQLLVTAPVLAYPLSEGEYILDTDASNFAMGAVLSQVQNGEERVIAYASQTLTPSQQNFAVVAQQSLHNSPSGGHLGRKTTLERVRYCFYWPRYKEHVILWCRRCDVCARSKSGPCWRAKLVHVSVGAPLERVAVDIMGPLPRTDNDNECLLVVGDYFTKWAEAYPLKDHTAQSVADVMVGEFVACYGLPEVYTPTRVGILSPS